jgi:hypothetical protein
VAGSTGCQTHRRCLVLGKDDLMNSDHASFSSALDLSELFYNLAVGRVGKQQHASDFSASGTLINKLKGDGGFIDPIQADEIAKNYRSHIQGTPSSFEHHLTMVAHQSADSSGSIANAENSRLRYVIVFQHVVVETDNPFVLTYRAALQLLQN